MSHSARALALLTLVAFGGCASHGATPPALQLYEPSDPTGLDPLVTDDATVDDLAPLIHGFLLGADDRGNPVPDLVREIPSRRNGGLSHDGRTIVYRLRRGVRWQDGAPFDARDVLFSFRAARDPRNDVPDRSGFDDVASVRAPNPYEVVVRLTRAYSPALATFFSLGANDPYPILPAHLLARLPELNDASYNGAPVGLGPYRLVRWERGSRLTLAADRHFRRGMPRIARVDVRFLPDSNTALAAWRAGTLDFFPVRGFSGSRAMLAGARSVTHARVALVDHYQFDYLMMNVAHGPLRDARVREAIVRGVDGARIEREVRGELDRPGDGDRLPGQFAYDPSIRQAAYDPARARTLLDAAGWRAASDGVRHKHGVPLALEIVGAAGQSGVERFDVQLQAQLTALGIAASVKTYRYALLFSSARTGGIFANGRFDLASYGWQPGEDADHSYLFRCDTLPPIGENYGRICDPAIDGAAARELAAIDPRAEATADRDLLRALDAARDVLFLGFDREAIFTRDDLDGAKPSVLGRHFWNVERWSLRR